MSLAIPADAIKDLQRAMAGVAAAPRALTFTTHGATVVDRGVFVQQLGIGDEGLQAVSECVTRSHELQSLKARGALLTELSGIPLASIVASSAPTLRSIDLYDNSVGDEGVERLVDALSSTGCQLQTLHLGMNNVGDAAAGALGALLEASTSLSALHLPCNSFELGAERLAEALVTNTALTKLDLASNQLGDAVAALVSTGNSTLQTLAIGDNAPSPDGLEALAVALNTQRGLTSLSLWKSNVDDQAASRLAVALMNNGTLTDLTLRWNAVGDRAAGAFSATLLSNTALSSLDLAGNEISNLGAARLATALRANEALLSLELSGNEVGDDGAAATAEALYENSTLTHLSLDNNAISGSGTVSLLDALAQNQTLQTLVLSGTGLGDEGEAKVNLALASTLFTAQLVLV